MQLIPSEELGYIMTVDLSASRIIITSQREKNRLRRQLIRKYRLEVREIFLKSSSLNSPSAAVTYCDDPQFRENNTDGWTTVTYKRNKHNYRYTGKRGTACDTECYAKFMAAERKIPIFISNVNKNCIETDTSITEYIRAKTKENIVLEKLNTKKKMHNAYKFYVFESKVSLFLDPELWPQNIVYRRFMHYRPNITKRQTNVGGPPTLING